MTDIRQADVADAIRIAALHIASWQAAYRNELPASFLALLDPGQGTADWAARIASRKITVLLIENASDLLGFCAHGWTEDHDAPPHTWEITNLHVRPDLRRAGIGGRLFDAALTAAISAAARTLMLWVVETNQSARRFYEQKGMQLEAGSHKAHSLAPGVLLHEVRYTLALPASKPE